ncbi:uncharacterized protein LOC141613762 [Silene latifolia]|uniref:uncharacterized protein LOC141613762 n=1 Tax=Silene latifolia TaxID=37657 RepID=UPI003D784541
MSKGKSNVYFNGVPPEVRAEIVQVSGCIEGTLPFKYLGVPIKPSKLTIKDCQPLIDKVLQRIRMLGTKKLSYAGRLVLVKAVFKSLHTYWASIFILPKGVIAKIEAICRNFLWCGSSEYSKTPTVAWDKICNGKRQGGLGLKNEVMWNKAAIGKLLWWIHAHPNKLWVQWVHSIYMRGTAWDNYQCPNKASWTWKKVCKLKTDMQPAYSQNEWSTCPGKEYTIAKRYAWLHHSNSDIDWHHQVWNKWTVPKHAIIAWLYHHRGLNTKDKLFRLNIASDNLCCICGSEEETLQHLFFKCQYSKAVLSLIREWTGFCLPETRDQDWRRNARLSRLKVGIINNILNAVTYHIWRQRNGSRHELQIQAPAGCLKMIQFEVRTKIQQQIKGTMSRRDRS